MLQSWNATLQHFISTLQHFISTLQHFFKKIKHFSIWYIFAVLKLFLGYLLLRLPIKVLTSSIIHLQCHLFWHQIRKFCWNIQKLAIFFTWSFHKILNLHFIVSVNFLYMLLSFKKISFGVQFYKHRRVEFIPIVLNQVYKSLRGAIAPLSLSQKYIFFSYKPTIFSCKMCKMLFWF